ncbi:hypothetical protein Mal64_37710 [Pseudobythopirellula maris]|uniref:Uncharacterized protein n=1 Tax=Pseudobythopirellula maris TaxID=2527991 RepID=A0A5C5ZJE4_9BACT|nr:hypothetical protein [Pseudobythopirellula maris]TWT86941.1 hypothetical protein Mal64_37710 [Pseudobythopirellula maris]
MINRTTFPTTIPDALFYDIYRTSSLTDWSQDWESFCEDEFVFWGPEFAYYFPRGFEDWVAEWDSIPGGGGRCLYGQRHDCSVSPSHVTHKWANDVQFVEINGKGPLTPLVQEYAGSNPYLLFTETLAKQLSATNLSGLGVRKAELCYANSSRYATEPERIGEQLYFLAGPNPLLTIPPTLNPEAPNSCPFCGYGPVICPKCGSRTGAKCPRCGIQMYNADSPPELVAKQIDTASIYASKEHQLANGAIDLARCDTLWDFSGINRVSRKMLDVLIDLDAGPMLIVPVKALFPDGRVGFTEAEAKPLIQLHQPDTP